MTSTSLLMINHTPDEHGQSYVTQFYILGPHPIYKGKKYIPDEECSWGAHLPYLGLEPVGG